MTSYCQAWKSRWTIYLELLIFCLALSPEVSAQQRQRILRRRQQQQPIYAEPAPVPVESQPGQQLVYYQDGVISNKIRPKVYEIRSEIMPPTGDGKFGYYVETSDGLQAQQVGYSQRPLASQVHQGSYTTFDETGKVVLINYIADKNGFRVAGADGVPTPPPLPQEHAEVRENILKEQAKIRQQHLSHLKSSFAAYGMVLE